MEVLYERCCGIDVHKSSVAACILLERGHKPQKHLRRFGCTTRDLRELAEWLRSFDVRYVAMESTGVYWKPGLELVGRALPYGACQSSAHQGGARPEDRHDGLPVDRGVAPPWSAAWHLCSISGDRDLRDLTRTRATLSQEQSGIRIQKLLESANIKRASVTAFKEKQASGTTGRWTKLVARDLGVLRGGNSKNEIG